jgi:tRNA threonylcarbamoyladenosine biosynthesis protein TsaE
MHRAADRLTGGAEGPTVLQTASAQATEEAAAALAGSLRPGDVVLVAGELGAGKTTFVRGAARALGVTGAVTSPTFTIGRRYRTAAGGWVSHLDLYRLADSAGEEPELLADYLTPDAVTFIEWPEVADAALVGADIRVAARVRLEHAGGDRRRLTIRRAQR